tara:strand:+ start:1864 stop:2139 length:276 start_codon:yes stop_codon:yes gene_type:complete
LLHRLFCKSIVFCFPLLKVKAASESQSPVPKFNTLISSLILSIETNPSKGNLHTGVILKGILVIFKTSLELEQNVVVPEIRKISSSLSQVP